MNSWNSRRMFAFAMNLSDYRDTVIFPDFSWMLHFKVGVRPIIRPWRRICNVIRRYCTSLRNLNPNHNPDRTLPKFPDVVGEDRIASDRSKYPSWEHFYDIFVLKLVFLMLNITNLVIIWSDDDVFYLLTNALPVIDVTWHISFNADASGSTGTFLLMCHNVKVFVMTI